MSTESFDAWRRAKPWLPQNDFISGLEVGVLACLFASVSGFCFSAHASEIMPDNCQNFPSSQKTSGSTPEFFSRLAAYKYQTRSIIRLWAVSSRASTCVTDHATINDCLQVSRWWKIFRTDGVHIRGWQVQHP